MNSEEIAVLGFRPYPSLEAVICHKVEVMRRAFGRKKVVRLMGVPARTIKGWNNGERIPTRGRRIILETVYKQALEKLLVERRKALRVENERTTV